MTTSTRHRLHNQIPHLRRHQHQLVAAEGTEICRLLDAFEHALLLESGVACGRRGLGRGTPPRLLLPNRPYLLTARAFG
jgi:hypothetical protein